MTFLSFCLFVLAQQPSGGALTYEWEATHPGMEDAPSLLPAPDLNLDGREDWIAYKWGEVRAISGTDGQQIWSSVNLGAFDVQLSDLNGDGSIEAVVTRSVSNGFESRVVCLNAHTGETLWESATIDPLAYKTEQVVIADTNNDGHQEILLTNASDWSNSPGAIYCLSDKGRLRWKHELDTPKTRYSVVKFEDIDADGTIDVIVSEPTYHSVDEKKREGRISRLDAASGDVIWEFLGGERGSLLGEQLEFIDLNSDGVSEILSLQPSARVNQHEEAGVVTCLTANGVGMWRVYGWETQQRLGEVKALGDGNRDGWQDLYLGLPETSFENGAVVAIDGRSGSELWRAEDWLDPGKRFGRGMWFSSGGLASHDWLVVDVGQDRDRGKREQAGVDFLHAGSGARVRAVPIGELVSRQYSDWVVRDLDGDGEPEVVFAHSEFTGGYGFVASVNSKNGLMWTRTGRGIGQALYVAEPEPGQAGSVRIVTSQVVPRTELERAGEIRGFELIARRERWHVTGALAHERLGDSIEDAVDSNGDPIGLIEVRSLHSFSPNGIRYYKPMTGELAWAAVSGNPEEHDFQVIHAPDYDQNGRRRSLIQDGANFRQVGEYPRTVPFLSASTGEVSAAQGGQIELYLDFGSRAAYYEYRVLASAHGIGESEIGGVLIVPLRADRIFNLSKDLALPESVLPAAEGSLNAYGETTVRVNFKPGQVPASAVGLSLQFCAVAREPWDDWTHCSVPVEVTFVP